MSDFHQFVGDFDRLCDDIDHVFMISTILERQRRLTEAQGSLRMSHLGSEEGFGGQPLSATPCSSSQTLIFKGFGESVVGFDLTPSPSRDLP